MYMHIYMHIHTYVYICIHIAIWESKVFFVSTMWVKRKKRIEYKKIKRQARNVQQEKAQREKQRMHTQAAKTTRKTRQREET